MRNSKKESLRELIARFKKQFPARDFGYWDYEKGEVAKIDFWELIEIRLDKEKRAILFRKEDIKEIGRLSKLSNEELEQEFKDFFADGHSDIQPWTSIEELLDGMSEDFWEFLHYSTAKMAVIAPPTYKLTGQEKYLHYIENVIHYNLLLNEILYRWNLIDLSEEIDSMSKSQKIIQRGN